VNRRARSRLALGALVAGALTGWHGCSVASDPAPASSGERPGYALRGIFERDSSATGFDHEAAIGFNMIDSGPYRGELNALARRGLKGFIWLGGYSNDSCKFREGNRWVRTHVRAIRRHPAVAAYLIDDEPDAARCPRAPAQMRARAKLVRSIDRRRGRPTFLVIYRGEQLARFAGTVDVLAIDKYPCSHKFGCVYSKIDRIAARADRLGIRYWGVIQAHADDWYKLPTPEELHEIFARWRATNMRGYLVFSWAWPPDDTSLWLANHPELQQQLAIENGL
jgi:hypothetical protein